MPWLTAISAHGHAAVAGPVRARTNSVDTGQPGSSATGGSHQCVTQPGRG